MPEKEPRKNKPGAGRPSRYRAEYVQTVLVLAKKGAVIEDICEALGVSKQTVYNWGEAHPEFLDALNTGRQINVQGLELKLYDQAQDRRVKRTRIVRDGEGNITKQVEEDYIIAGNPLAGKLIMQAYDPRYREKHEIEHHGSVNIIMQSDPVLDGDDE